MNTKMRMLVCVLALAPAWTGLRAADNPIPPATGHILILENERTLEGDIERVGDQYRIKRTVGEIWVPAEKVMWLCADLPEAYAFLRRRANLDDADERLRLAKWCHAQGLREEALAEVNAVIAIKPRQQEAQRLLRRLQQAAPVESSTSTSTTEPAPVAAPPVDVSAEAMNQFATRIQPILMNACANCHGAGQGGAFKLIRTHEHGSLVPKTTQQNLTSVLAQVNLEQPRSSPLLTKAGSVHGAMGEAPLSGRKTPAYHALEEWVKLTLATQSTAHDQRVLPAAESSSKTSKPAAAKSAVEKPGPGKCEEAIAPASEKTTAKEPADPFDPVLFNREAHPDR